MEIVHDLAWSFATRIRICLIEADTDPTDQNVTDPNGSETLVKSEGQKFWGNKLRFKIWGGEEYQVVLLRWTNLLRQVSVYRLEAFDQLT